MWLTKALRGLFNPLEINILLLISTTVYFKLVLLVIQYVYFSLHKIVNKIVIQRSYCKVNLSITYMYTNIFFSGPENGGSKCRI